jgi:lipopolysaccharide transport system ATP-binding protein
VSDAIIRAEGLGKKYVIGHQVESGGYLSLRDVWARSARNLWRKTTDLARGRPVVGGNVTEEIWVLDAVNFAIQRGESVGIIGRNGAGKSTLLKILSRITEPSAGRVTIKGRVASLLEVGTGFHPELTGRENIYLNGAILGMARSEIKRQFDEIVAFAEVEKFLDTPVKRYSSGMYVRLAFAVAAHLEPEILVVDEVLAVGDAQFQKKCLGKMGEVAQEGRTVLFVSHNMGAVQGLCRRAIWLDMGRVVGDGDARAVIGRYINSANDNFLQHSRQERSGHEELTIEHVVLRNERGEPVLSLSPGEDVRIDIHYTASRPIPRPYFWISIDSQFGSLFGANMLFDDLRPDSLEGTGVISCVFRNVKLLPQTFTVSMGVRDHTGAKNLIKPAAVAAFNVTGVAHDFGMPGELANSLLDSSTPMIVPYEWRFMDGRIAVPSWQK